MKTVQHIIVFVTAKNKTEAQKIAKRLLQAKLVACANIAAGVESHFWWQGAIDSAEEVLVIIKTKRSLFKKLVLEVRALHSYENPEIIALPVIDGSSDYLKWIDASVI